MFIAKDTQSFSEAHAEDWRKSLVKSNPCLGATAVVLVVIFKLWAQGITEPPDSVSESIQQIIRHIGQEMAPAIHHLTKDSPCQFNIMSFVINIHSLTNARQHNDFINNSSSVTSTSETVFASFLWRGVHYFLHTDYSLSNKWPQLADRSHVLLLKCMSLLECNISRQYRH